MCGILGSIGQFDNINHDTFHEALIRSNYRGPDYSDSQNFISSNNQVFLGHNRLSIIDLNPTGNQPKTSHSKNNIIIFNGEIYNHLELRKKFSSDYKWDSNSDTETLIELIERFGIAQTLSMIRGMFAFAVYDFKADTITLARDISGEKPLYLYFHEKGFIFSSDLNSPSHLGLPSKKINQTAINQLLKFNYIPAPLCIYKSTFKLPAASFMTVDLKKFKHKTINSFNDLTSATGIEFKKFWSMPEQKDQFDASSPLSEMTKKTEYLLEESISMQQLSDVPIGAFLSGGIDSSLVVALMQKNSSSRIKTFNIGFEFSEYDESPYAMQIAKHLNTDHYSTMCTKAEALKIIPSLPNAFAEPFADSSQIPTMLVSKIAKEHVSVVLSGDGGDELFGGYNRYLLSSGYWKILRWVPAPIRKKIFYILSKYTLKQSTYVLKYLFPTMLSGDYTERVEKLFNKLSKIGDDYSFYTSLTGSWNELRLEDLNLDYQSTFNNLTFKTLEEKMMAMDFQTYLPDDILCKVDRSSMYYSLETRTPFLNQDLVEQAYKLPLGLKITNGKTKNILREILSKYVPNKMYERPKMGFGIPIPEWLRSDLKDWAAQMLFECPATDQYLPTDIIKSKWDDHQLQKNNNFYELWSVIQLNQWMNNQNSLD
jgi:asparagine synthase (glutamine-hydrolysing)